MIEHLQEQNTNANRIENRRVPGKAEQQNVILEQAKEKIEKSAKEQNDFKENV